MSKAPAECKGWGESLGKVSKDFVPRRKVGRGVGVHLRVLADVIAANRNNRCILTKYLPDLRGAGYRRKSWP